MEILFENKFTKNKEWAKDAFGYICFRRPLKIAIDVFFAIYLFFGLLSIIVINDNIEYFFIVVPIIWWVLSFLQYNRCINASLKRDLEMHGKEIDVVTIVTEDLIRYSQSTGSEFQLQYSDIKKVVQTKGFIYLWSKTNMLYSFKKDSFSIGNTTDFLLFLKNKGIKVK